MSVRGMEKKRVPRTSSREFKEIPLREQFTKWKWDGAKVVRGRCAHCDGALRRRDERRCAAIQREGA